MDILNFKPEKSRISQSEKSELFNKGFAWCSKCKIVVKVEDFASNKSKYLGLGSSCKECDKKASEARKLSKTITDDDRAKERGYRRLKRLEKSSKVREDILNNPKDFKPAGKCVSNVESAALKEAGYKWCNRCKSVLSINDFHKEFGYCKSCCSDMVSENSEDRKVRDKEYYIKNRDLKIKQAAEYRKNNPDKIKKSREKYYESHKNEVLERNSKYREDNIDKIKAQQKDYYFRNKDHKNKVSANWRKENRDHINRKQRERYRKDIGFKNKTICRELVRRMLASTGRKKNFRTKEILGYEPKDLRLHIESLFKPGMTWDNYGKWHVDHIIPISSAKTLAEGIILSQLSNLQPLWAEENLSKGSKLSDLEN